MYSITYKYSPGDKVWRVEKECGITELKVDEVCITIGNEDTRISYNLKRTKNRGYDTGIFENALYPTLQSALAAYEELLS
jgi:hypothetical protein